MRLSKGAGDQYVRDYARIYGLDTVVLRMSCIHGPRQFGVEDQGWVAHFLICAVLGRPITIYGDGKQVRDILYATDVASAFMAFFERGNPGIYNVGGGGDNAISLLECIDLIDECTGKKSTVRFEEPRFGDLKYFVCDIARARGELGWTPQVRPNEGVPLLIAWVEENRHLFAGGDR